MLVVALRLLTTFELNLWLATLLLLLLLLLAGEQVLRQLSSGIYVPQIGIITRLCLHLCQGMRLLHR